MARGLRTSIQKKQPLMRLRAMEKKKIMRAHPVSKIKETNFVFLFYFSECRKRPGNRRTRKEAPDASRASRGARKDLAIAYLEGERESQTQGVRGRGRERGGEKEWEREEGGERQRMREKGRKRQKEGESQREGVRDRERARGGDGVRVGGAKIFRLRTERVCVRERETESTWVRTCVTLQMCT